MNYDYELKIMDQCGIGIPDPATAKEIGFIDYVQDKITGQNCLLTLKNRVLYLSFSGTQNFKNVIEDLLEFPLISEYKEEYGNDKKVYKFHRGFYLDFKSIENMVNHSIPDTNIFDTITCVGHSLGASVAGIYAGFYSKALTSWKVTRLVTCAQPMYANKSFINMMEHRVRVECFLNGYDPIRPVAPFLSRNRSVNIGNKWHWWDFIFFNINYHNLWNTGNIIGYSDSLKEYSIMKS